MVELKMIEMQFFLERFLWGHTLSTNPCFRSWWFSLWSSICTTTLIQDATSLQTIPLILPVSCTVNRARLRNGLRLFEDGEAFPPDDLVWIPSSEAMGLAYFQATRWCDTWNSSNISMEKLTTNCLNMIFSYGCPSFFLSIIFWNQTHL